ncbi:DNA internalization-related competence protein ComEC/Rec2 [Oxalobacteraceae bacterium A2-2]
MRGWVLGWVAGTMLLQAQAVLPRPGWCWLYAALALGLVAPLLVRRKTGAIRDKLARLLACAMAAGLLGFAWSAAVATHVLDDALPLADEGRDIVMTGVVDSLPYRFEQGVRFNFAVESEGVAPRRVALSWYAGYRGALRAVPDVQPGQRWRFTVRLQRPHGNANPYGFDYEAWLLEQGVRATGYVRSDSPSARLADVVPGFGYAVERCRAVLRARILRALAGKEYAGVIVALVVGDQRGIGQDDWQVFNRTGIGHLISISGLHITMVAGLFAMAAFKLWAHSFHTHAQLPLLLPAQKVAALAGALAAFAYVLLAGFGVPAQRTLYMLCVVAIALWSNRITAFSHVLCCALGVVVVLDPWAVMWPGFWLSFGAVAIIMYATVGRTVQRVRRRPAGPQAAEQAQAPCAGLRGAMYAAVATQYAVTVGLVPLTMLLFSQVSLVSPLANAIAIPLVSLVVTPLSLLGCLLPAPLATLVLGLAHLLVQWLAALLQWCSAWPAAVWSAPEPPWWVFAWALFGTLWLLAPRGWPQRWLGLATWVPLLAAQPTHPEPGKLRITAFDVGQGMALLVETSGHRLLYDTGPAYTPESNAGNRVILPYLRSRGIHRLDGVIVSHSDTDHAGGALQVLQGVAVGWLSSSLPLGHPAVRAAAAHSRCMAGQRWGWDGVQFEMLHPAPESYQDAALKPNARGCTLKITARGGSVLLAADIEARQEAELLRRVGTNLKADILLAPHHGSGTSSTAAFLQAVRPEVALFQVGYRNRYRHPKQEVWDRYGALGMRRLRTDASGAVTIDIGDGIGLEEYRRERTRYWYGY